MIGIISLLHLLDEEAIKYLFDSENRVQCEYNFFIFEFSNLTCRRYTNMISYILRVNIFSLIN